MTRECCKILYHTEYKWVLTRTEITFWGMYISCMCWRLVLLYVRVGSNPAPGSKLSVAGIQVCFPVLVYIFHKHVCMLPQSGRLWVRSHITRGAVSTGAGRVLNAATKWFGSHHIWTSEFVVCVHSTYTGSLHICCLGRMGLYRSRFGGPRPG